MTEDGSYGFQWLNFFLFLIKRKRKKHLLVSRQFLGRTQKEDSFQLISCALVIKEASQSLGIISSLVYKLECILSLLLMNLSRVIPVQGQIVYA